MFEILEDQFNELKEIFDEDIILKEIVGFLNSEGGNIYIGVNDNNEIIGVNKEKLDEIQNKISNYVSDSIQPQPISLIKSFTLEKEDKLILKIEISKGYYSFYSIKKYGFSSKGCPIRVGATTKQIDFNEINRRYENNFKKNNDYLTLIKSNYTSLSFSLLKSYLINNGYSINENSFLKNYYLINDENNLNLLGELLSDNNKTFINLLKYDSEDESSISTLNNYGNKPIFLSYLDIKNRLISENICKIDVSIRPRKEIYLYDFECVNEALINAFVHNDWTFKEPIIKFFNNRIEILSYGGLPLKQTKEDFFNGISIPRNINLMRIFQLLNISEQSGHGIIKIISKYGKDIFEIKENYIKMVFPFNFKLEISGGING